MNKQENNTKWLAIKYMIINKEIVVKIKELE